MILLKVWVEVRIERLQLLAVDHQLMGPESRCRDGGKATLIMYSYVALGFMLGKAREKKDTCKVPRSK